MIIKNRHGNTSVNTAVSLKKGDFNTPYESQFFEKKKGGRNVVFQTAATSQNPISLYSNGFVFRCYILEPKRADNRNFNLACYRLCIFASGSLITNIFICCILIKVSCLHFGQYNGKFNNTVSS